jgi:hypothetical protein
LLLFVWCHETVRYNIITLFKLCFHYSFFDNFSRGCTNAIFLPRLIISGSRSLASFVWQELLDLGEAVGTQSRGLSQEQISLLPVTKYKCGFFSRKKRHERSDLVVI